MVFRWENTPVCPVYTQLNLFYSQLLENIDPNPDNFVSAGIIHTRSAQIGCLLRLEPNKQAQVTESEPSTQANKTKQK